MNQQHCLVFDPIEFKGGSKIATREMLSLTDARQVRYTIVTRHPQSWMHDTRQQSHSRKSNIHIVPLPSLGQLNRATHGVKFWLKHGMYLLFLLRLRLTLGPIDLAIGASGPGVDMALYLLRRCLRFRLIQLIHGPVGYSRAIGQCLLHADQVFYLASAQPSMQRAINVYYHYRQGPEHAPRLTQMALSRPHFQIFTNGISKRQWPSRCQSHTPVIFWCASLLKWKGLDLLLETLNHLSNHKHRGSFTTNICYIQPKNSTLEFSTAPQPIADISWFNDPKHLDQIRRESNIFISTSQQEPFGLSILEALAAGMCVIIPQDGAYWDKVLTDQVNCLKYQPGQMEHLSATILTAAQDPTLIQRLGQAAIIVAYHYSAEACYQHIYRCLENAGGIESRPESKTQSKTLSDKPLSNKPRSNKPLSNRRRYNESAPRHQRGEEYDL